MLSRTARHNLRQATADLFALLRSGAVPMGLVLLAGIGAGLSFRLFANVFSVVPFVFLLVAGHEAAHALVGRRSE